MPFISSFDIIRIVLFYAKLRTKVDDLPDPEIFSCISASVADAAAVNPKGFKTLLVNGLITLFISGNPVFSNEPRSLPRNPPDCII